MTEFDTKYWEQGQNQPQISPNSSRRSPAFVYHDSDLAYQTFDRSNWNDVMLHPLRQFLREISADCDGWEDVDSPIETIYNSELKVTICYIPSNDQSNFIIKPKDNEDTIFISYYKNRGCTEQILNDEMRPVFLYQLDNIYDILHLKEKD
jgi:hypothetical protein